MAPLNDDDDDATVTGPLVVYRLRALENLMGRMDTKLDTMAGKFVSTELYNADKQGNAERHVRAEARIRDLEQEAGEREKQGRTTRLSISLATVSGVIAVASIIAGFLR